MKTLAALALVLAVGCSNAPVDVPPVSAAERAAQDAATHAPTCAVSMSAPALVEGSNFFGAGSLTDCNESDWDGRMEIRFAQGATIAGITIDRTQAVAGNTLDLGVQATAFTNGYEPCVGVVTWTSDEPDWAVSVNAVCGDKLLVATFHGHNY